MTIEEKRNKLKEFCDDNHLKSVNGCKNCPIRECNFSNCMFETFLPYQVEVGYQRAFGDEKAKEEISMNMIANILGLGNAATPLGLKAMKTLQKENPKKDTSKVVDF